MQRHPTRHVSRAGRFLHKASLAQGVPGDGRSSRRMFLTKDVPGVRGRQMRKAGLPLLPGASRPGSRKLVPRNRHMLYANATTAMGATGAGRKQPQGGKDRGHAERVGARISDRRG
ncbi:hypothetical protein GCM10019059_22740 [Camelimonas fluminis]|nr:hypothetical protein GCM10019059_22740 [Camelimonas fluminis]